MRWWWAGACGAHRAPLHGCAGGRSLLPLAFGAATYGLGAVVGGLNFLRKTAALARAPHERARAMGAFFASMMQLSAIIAGVLIDAALR